MSCRPGGANPSSRIFVVHPFTAVRPFVIFHRSVQHFSVSSLVGLKPYAMSCRPGGANPSLRIFVVHPFTAVRPFVIFHRSVQHFSVSSLVGLKPYAMSCRPVGLTRHRGFLSYTRSPPSGRSSFFTGVYNIFLFLRS